MTSPAARRRPPGRYDAPPLLGQRVLAVLLAVLVLALAAAAASYAWDRFGGQQVRGQVRAFDIRSDDEVVLDLEVTKTAGAQAYCVVRAQAADAAEVGRDVAVLDAVGTSDTVVRSSFVLRTTRRAVAAELLGCTADPISKDEPAP